MQGPLPVPGGWRGPAQAGVDGRLHQQMLMTRAPPLLSSLVTCGQSHENTWTLFSCAPPSTPSLTKNKPLKPWNWRRPATRRRQTKGIAAAPEDNHAFALLERPKERGVDSVGAYDAR